MKKLFYFATILTIAFVTMSCEEKNDINDSTKNKQVNSWIKYNMDKYYLWNINMPYIEPNTNNPEKYFYNSLISKDKWSFISNDAKSLISEFSGNPVSTGIEPFFAMTDNGIVIIALYVQQGSNAEKAGIKRGDIISKINGKSLTTENYYNQFSQSSYSATLAKLENDILVEKTTVQLTAGIISTQPVAFDTVYSIENKNIGYISIITFTEPDNFIPNVGAAIERLKAKNIDELIVDLRYNRGGTLGSAQWLSSVCAPGYVNSTNRLINVEYNKSVSTIAPPSEKYLNFESNTPNLGLNKITFLTAPNTASASELVIIGLKPYMTVTSIGENTYGKYVGSFVIYDENPQPSHNYAMLPITFKYSNSDGYTDFDNGLTPDVEIKDDPLNMKPFGDISDPIINAAISNVTGITVKSAPIGKKIEYTPLPNPRQESRSILIYDKE